MAVHSCALKKADVFMMHRHLPAHTSTTHFTKQEIYSFRNIYRTCMHGKTQIHQSFAVYKSMATYKQFTSGAGCTWHLRLPGRRKSPRVSRWLWFRLLTVHVHEACILYSHIYSHIKIKVFFSCVL